MDLKEIYAKILHKLVHSDDTSKPEPPPVVVTPTPTATPTPVPKKKLQLEKTEGGQTEDSKDTIAQLQEY